MFPGSERAVDTAAVGDRAASSEIERHRAAARRTDLVRVSAAAVNGAGSVTNPSGGVFNETLASTFTFAPAFTNQSGAAFSASGTRSPKVA